MSAASVGVCADRSAAALPDGVRAVWDMSRGLPRDNSHPRAASASMVCGNGNPPCRRATCPQTRIRVISRSPAAGPESPTTSKETAKPSLHIQVGRMNGSAASVRPGIGANLRAEGLERPSNYPLRRVSQFARQGVRRWQEGGGNGIPIGRSRFNLGMSSGRQARARHAGGRRGPTRTPAILL